MKHQIKTSIVINATPEKVWTVLTNFKEFPSWNPFIKSIEGELQTGNKIKAIIEPPSGKEMTFKPELLVVEKNKELRWLGKFLINGIFNGEHYFKINKQEDGAIHFEHGEIFSGILVKLMPKALVNTKLGFELMNKALKKMCEDE